jgi:nucleoside-diphosphate-sugar epimerase
MTMVLVTGATGMLGRCLVERLISSGEQVRVLVRPSSEIRYLQNLPVEIISGDIENPQFIRQAVAGIEFVFHLAGYLQRYSAFDIADKTRQYQKINVDFTHLLLDASYQTGVSRFVYVSSTSIYDPHALSPIAENASLRPITAYGQSKLEAENIIRRYQERGCATTIVRPCTVYGAHDRYFMPTALQISQMPLLALIAGGHTLQDLVYVADVVELIWAASQSPVSIGKVYNAASGTPMPFRQFYEVLAEFTGHKPLLLPIPRRFAFLIRFYLARYIPDLEMFFSPAGINYLSRDIYYDISLAQGELNYIPQFNFRSGLAATFRSLV